MSSGLEVTESNRKGWVGKRVWINLSALGFESLYRGGALQRNETRRLEGDASNYRPDLHESYRRQLECKSAWLQHVSLSGDMTTERGGIKVRPIPGLAGVDYLTPGALTSHVSYVFGPVIRALKRDGEYADGEDLDAAPYDWRLPPSVLEERDGYFTSTMLRVEEMYRRNGDTPVVLLCHSLGCKTGHYLLNFALGHPNGGRRWLDRYIHTYMPVGAPHLGAPKAIRATVDGDKMGLDAFLNDEEGLVLGRSLGSGPWLMPRTLPDTGDVLPNVFVRSEGALEVTLPPIDCHSLIGKRRGAKPRLRLAVVFGGEVLTTDFRTPGGRNGCTLTFSETFVFSTPPDLSALRGRDNSDAFQVLLQEPGVRNKRDRSDKSDVRIGIECLLRIVCCPIQYCLCLPCTLAGCIVCKTLCAAKEVTLMGVDAAAAALGSGTTLAMSEPFRLRRRLVGRSEAEVMVGMVHVGDRERTWDCFRRARSTDAAVRLKWVPPLREDRPMIDIAAPTPAPGNDPGAYGVGLRHHNKDHVQYKSGDGAELLKNERLDRALDLVRDRYDGDPIGPRTLSAEDPPPVRRVKAIYGINLPTEVGAVYRRHKATVLTSGAVRNLRRVDSGARIPKTKTMGAGYRKYKIQNGILLETPGTAQAEEGGRTVCRSGDGTVPYWSLRHCKTWGGPECEVSVEEIEGAEHRDILADPRFHRVVIDYVTGKAS